MRILIFLGCSFISLVLLTQCQSSEKELAGLATPSLTPTSTPAIGLTVTTFTPFATDTTVSDQSEPQTSEPAATVSPTPFIYFVENGDTLIGIAGKHNITVQDIEALNPGIQPELLLVGQPLILPPPQTTPVAPNAESTLTHSDLRLLGVSSYTTPQDGLWILGEVHNRGIQSVESVEVEITLLTLLGEPLMTTTAWAVTGFLQAGDKAPFGVLIDDIPSHYDFFSAEVVGGQSINGMGNRYFDLEVASTEVTIQERLVRVSGRLLNTGSQNARQLSLVTTLYDELGNVTGYHELLLPGALAANESTLFEIEIVPPGNLTSKYSFAVQALADQGQ